jgi:hypothetical protein
MKTMEDANIQQVPALDPRNTVFFQGNLHHGENLHTLSVTIRLSRQLSGTRIVSISYAGTFFSGFSQAEDGLRHSDDQRLTAHYTYHETSLHNKHQPRPPRYHHL